MNDQRGSLIQALVLHCSADGRKEVCEGNAKCGVMRTAGRDASNLGHRVEVLYGRPSIASAYYY